MITVSETKPFKILNENDPPAVQVENAAGSAPLCLVCEHASAAIPLSLGDLGLSETDRYSHAVWDIGAKKLAQRLSQVLDAPLVLGGLSRLVYDCNRPPERADAMPVRTEVIEIPGNRDISDAERKARVQEVYYAFHKSLDELIDSFAEPPTLVTVHSFTPSWHGKPRSIEIGLLHDENPSLARAMQQKSDGRFSVELNEPYSSVDGVTHMLARHGTSRGLQNVMIEVRNDLLATDDAINGIANSLDNMLVKALAIESHTQ